MGPYPCSFSGRSTHRSGHQAYAYTAAGLLQYEGWANSVGNPSAEPAGLGDQTVHLRRQQQARFWSSGPADRLQRTNVWDNCATLSYQ
jgi:hypothetical protein